MYCRKRYLSIYYVGNVAQKLIENFFLGGGGGGRELCMHESKRSPKRMEYRNLYSLI